MQIRIAFLNSKVAKRLFYLFIFAAIIPVALIGVVTFNYVTTTLTENSFEHLSYASKSYGLSVYDRINTADLQFKYLINNLETSNVVTEKLNSDSQLIMPKEITIFDDIIISKTLSLLNNANIKHLVSGKTSISIDTSHDIPEILFSRLLSVGNSVVLLTARVDKNHIFGDMDVFSGDKHSCIVAHKAILNCSEKNINIDFIKDIINDENRTSTKYLNDEKFIVAKWELFLKGGYQADAWKIIFYSPSSAAFASVNSFVSKLVPLLILSILLVSSISINQISAILVPLEKLITATKKIAKRDFSEKVKFNSNDEFQSLGDSFNLMSSELDNQFSLMATMSKIDKTILTTMNKKDVVKDIFKNLKNFIQYNDAAILMFAEDNTKKGYLYLYRIGDYKIGFKKLAQIDKKEITLLLNTQNNLMEPIASDKFNKIPWLRNIHSAYITPLAIKNNNKISGIIIIGHQSLSCIGETSLGHLEIFSDRLNVAFHAIHREEKLIKQANYDSLTGLPNRHLLIKEFNNLYSNIKNKKENVAVLFIDLDRFKIINDSQGHSIGDKLLIEASRRIQSCVKKYGIVARYGGDEFVVLLPCNTDTSKVTATANNIIEALSKKFNINKYEQYISASIGIALYPSDSSNWEGVLQKSDIAMYRAKKSGRSKYLFYNENMKNDIVEKASLEADLCSAIDKNQLYMVYQPQIDIEKGDIIGAESLMRWNHETLGAVHPDKFINYAEESGFIVKLGMWAINEVLKQCEIWHNSHQKLEKVSVNVSPKQIIHEKFIPNVKALIAKYDIGTLKIEFEITENLSLNEDDNIINKLFELNRLGINIAIDDFGKGYSSLSYLKNLPIQTLKIDKNFIDDICEDKDAVSIVSAIIAVSKTLNKTVIAEGIETVEQMNILKELGCDIAQGYFTGKPKRAEDIMDFSKTVIINLEEYRKVN